MFARIIVSTVFVAAAASQAAGQQYYVPPQQSNANRQGVPVYSLSDTTPTVRPASAPLRAQEPVPAATEPTSQVGSNYLNSGSAGCCSTPTSPAGCCSSPSGSCDNASGCDVCACPNPPGSKYLKAFGGWNEAYDINVPQTNTQFDLDSGWAMGVGVGRQLTCNLRREIELTYRNNSAEDRTVQSNLFAPQVTPLSGNLNCFSIGHILLYDFHKLTFAGATPYVGGGIGGAYIDADFSDGVNNYAISDTAFSYNAILGVSRPMGGRASAFAEYRFFGTTAVDFETPMSTFDVNYQAHGVFVGLRIAR